MNRKHSYFLLYSFFFTLMISACTYTPKSRGLSAEEFEVAFRKDCAIITGIEEMHHFTAYTINGNLDATLTTSNIFSWQMRSWLADCGRNPKSVSWMRE